MYGSWVRVPTESLLIKTSYFWEVFYFNIVLMPSSKPETIDEYIARYPVSTREMLEQLRAIIRKAAPQANEVISYQMPAYKLNGMLVWFGAHSKHIGFYPRASGIAAFKKELAGYTTSKGAVQFPLDKPLPSVLITKIVKFRVSENLENGKK